MPVSNLSGFSHGVGEGELLLGGRLELIGIGGFLMVEYHKSSAAYANQLKLRVRKISGAGLFGAKYSQLQNVGEMA